MNKFGWFLALVASVLMADCASGGIAVEHVNKSDLRLNSVSVRWNSIETVAGLLPPGVTKTDDLIASKLPKIVEVRWETPDGVLHEQELQVPPLHARPRRGELPTIVVTFTEEGVDVSTTTS